MYTFSEKRPRAVASAREISYDRGKGGDGVIEILEQTPGLVVCIKPVGVRAQGEGENDLPALLKRQLGCEIYPVHRLDQAVGGVMVFAKTAPVAAKLSQAIAGGTLQKEYLRDKTAGLPIHVPENYFPDDDDTQPPRVTWRSHANLLYQNWLNYFVYQATPYDLDTIEPVFASL